MNREGDAEFAKRWQKPGDELHTSVPAMVFTDYPHFDFWDGFYEYASVNVLKGDNIRLLYINPGYDFIVKYKSKPSLFKTVTLYSNMGNAGIIWKQNKEKIDPDYPYGLAPSKQYTITFAVALRLQDDTGLLKKRATNCGFINLRAAANRNTVGWYKVHIEVCESQRKQVRF